MAIQTTIASQQAGEWTCECGQAYRVAVLRSVTRFWPRNSVDGYSRHGLTERARCIRCGRSPRPRESSGSDDAQDVRRAQAGRVWLWIGIGGFLLYAVLLLTCGIRAGRRGHPVLFIVGFFFPILWVVGAVLPDNSPQPYT